jgi:hypothetical protein
MTCPETSFLSTEHHIQNAAGRASPPLQWIDSVPNPRRSSSSATSTPSRQCSRKRGGRVRVRIETILSDLKADHYPTIRELLLEGCSAWVQDGHDAAEFQEMLVK